MRLTFFFLLFGLFCSVQSFAQETEANPHEGFQTFEMKSGDSTILMKQYVMCFLKSGPERSQNKEEAAEIQKGHLAHLSKLGEDKKICMAGPFGDDTALRGIVIYNTPTVEEAEKLANEDPAVKAGRLIVELHPIWLAVGTEMF
jgi:uncharacterized protein YciI